MISRKSKAVIYRFLALLAVVAIAVLAWTALYFSGAKRAHADDTVSTQAAAFNHASATALSEIDLENDKPTTGSYYLTDDIVLSKTWELFNDETINICLHGHTITAGKQTVLEPLSDSVFNIYDCGGDSGTGHGAVTGGRGVYVYGGELNLYGGAIRDTNSYAGVSIAGGGVFNMYGGEITGCVTSGKSDSSGVWIGYYGTFNMYGGSIHDNITGSHYGGGGVYLDEVSAVFHMYGGEIKNNKIDAMPRFFEGNQGGIVYTKKVTDEELEKFYKGAGVNATTGTFTLEGDVVITGNYRFSEQGDKVSNVEVDESTKINITGRLGSNTQIGILAPKGAFTSGYAAAGNTQAPSTFFTSDDSALIVGYDELRVEGAITDDDGEYNLVSAEIANEPTTTVGDTVVNFTLNVTLKNKKNNQNKTIPALVKVELDEPLTGAGKKVNFTYTYNGADGVQTETLEYVVHPNKLNVNVTWVSSGSVSTGSNTARRDYDGSDILSTVTASYVGYDGEQVRITGSWSAGNITVKDGDGNSVSEAIEAGEYKFSLPESADYEFSNNLFTVRIFGSEEEGYYQLQSAKATGVNGTPTAGDKTITVIIERKLKHTKDQPDKTEYVDYEVTLATPLHGGLNTIDFVYRYTEMGNELTKKLSLTISNVAKKKVTIAWYFYDTLVSDSAVKHIYDGVDASDKIVAVFDGIDGNKQRIDGSSSLMVRKDGSGNTATSMLNAGEYTLSLSASTDYEYSNNLFTYTVVEELSDIVDLVYEENGKTIMGVSCAAGFENGTELLVEETTCDPSAVDGDISTVYGVKFVKDSAEVAPAGSVTVHILIPEELHDVSKYEIYSLKNGVATKVQYISEGNYAIFDADDLDGIAFVIPKSAPPVGPTADPDDTDLTWLWILLVILAVCIAVAIVVFILLKRRKEKETVVVASEDGAAAKAAPVEKSKPVKQPEPVAPSAPEEPKKPEGIVCPDCGKQNVEGAMFCGKCGKKFEVKHEEPAPEEPKKPEGIVCPDCGKLNPEGSKFCRKCGKKLI